MSVRDRLIQLTLRARNFLSGDVAPATESMRELTEEGRRLKASMDEVGRARGLARTLRDNQQATEGLARSQADARATLDDLTREIGDNATATAGQRIALREARRTLEEAESAYKRNQQAIKNTTSELEKLGVDTGNVVAEEKRLTGELESGKQALAANREAIREKRVEEKKAADTSKEHADRIDAAKGAMASGVRQVVAFAAAYVSLNAAIGLVQRGLSLVSQGIRAIAMEGSDKQQALAQLEATLASTGRQAEFTTQQLLDMADAMEANSMLTAEQVQSAQARLLSYTDVAANEFPRALQIVIDQQQRLGISAEASAEIVGRALQSPSKAMAALSRQGFTLEAGQQRLLKQLEATGRMAEAQSIIMDMLTEAYGGAAAAARLNTAAGLWKGITDRIGDFTSRVANSGAFDYIQRKLVEVSDGLDAMANDGRLDRLAQSLSDAFVSGSEALSQYVEKLATVDFEGLAARAARAAEQIGPAIESTLQAARVVTATLTTVWNGFAGTVNAAGAALVLVVQQTVGRLGLAIGQIAELFGNSDLRAKADGLYNFLGELSQGYAEQAKTDYQQIADAWDTTTEHVKAKAKEQTETISLESVSQADFVRQAVTSMQGALDQISAAKTVAQLRQVGDEMFAAYKRGDISQQEYSASSVELSRRLKDLGGTARSAGAEVSGLANGLESLSDVQSAIARARTDVDISNIRTALRKLYSDGVVNANEYAKAQAELNERVAALKPAAEASTKAVKEQGDALEGTASRVRSVGDAAEEAGSGLDFFGAVLTAARTPLANMSEAALAAFDALQGIQNFDAQIDMESIEGLREGLLKVKDEAAALQAELGLIGSRDYGLGIWMRETALRSREVQARFLEQRLELQKLMDGYESGSTSLASFVGAARSAQNSLDLLDSSDLSQLESAIASAEQRMQQLGESSRNTLASLQDELDKVRGNEDAIERRRAAQRRRELEQQLEEARQGGDSQAVANLQQSLSLLRQIEAETAQQREQQANQQRAAQQQAAPAASAQQAEPTKVIRLETARGRRVDVSVPAGGEDALLGILEEAGLRSL
ncbi:phage tail length tape measure family protein [Ectopseudomonas hydrolytica]|uniref:phage tail length tape measure family protein n=1 Tax=Ectopseudomonas hydrolytica TaxID=2493633 RepID=UPI00376EAA64